MSWNFAIVNQRLAELYFEKQKNERVPHGHCYVNRDEFTKKREQKEIDIDIKRYIFSYRNKKYKNALTGKTYPVQV